MYRIVRGRVDTSMYIYVASISEWLDKGVPISLVLSTVVSQSRDSCLVASLYLSVGLWVIRGGCRAFDSYVSTYGCEECAYKLRVVLG